MRSGTCGTPVALVDSLRLLEQHALLEVPMLLVACDMSYDPEAVSAIFSSAGEVLAASAAANPLVLFARSEPAKFRVSGEVISLEGDNMLDLTRCRERSHL